MKAKVTIAEHPVHPMLVSFPIAMYAASAAAYLTFKANKDPFWFKAGYVANLAGIGSALAAAVPGFIDWLTAIPNESEAKTDGLIHALLNVSALTAFGVNAIRESGKWDDPQPEDGNPLLPLLGLGITLAAGIYGWTLVQKHRIGVMDEEQKQPQWYSKIKREVSAVRHPFPDLEEEPIHTTHPGFNERL